MAAMTTCLSSTWLPTTFAPAALTNTTTTTSSSSSSSSSAAAAASLSSSFLPRHRKSPRWSAAPASFPLPSCVRTRTPCPSRLSVSATAAPAAGRGNWSLGAPEGTVDLCVFPMWSMPLPTSSGSLNVFEPHLVALLQVVQQVAAATPEGGKAHFAMLPYDWVQHEMLAREPDLASQLTYLGNMPAAMESFSRLGEDAVGCCCEVETALQEPSAEAWWVQYRVKRRFKPLQVLRRQPFLVVRGAWVDDEKGKSSQFEGQAADALEQQVWGKIQDVVKYTAKINGTEEVPRCCGGPGAVLPETVCKFSPLAAPRPTTAEERVRAWTANPSSRMPSEVSVWRNMKSATAVAPKPAPAASNIPYDPYAAAAESLSKAVRQEAFSFAAATLVDLGAEQRMELLNMTNTAERLHWLLEAIEPHLGALRAEYSMKQAMGDM